MNLIFQINFRREAYLQEVRMARQRVIVLGLWVSYFGVLGVAIGLYGLNLASLVHRTGVIERQAARLQASQGAHRDWSVGPAELAQVETYTNNPRQWRDRLVRITRLLPPNARLHSLAVNPDNLSSPADQNKLVITGELRVPAGMDRMQGVMQLVSALRRDSLFAAGYQNVRLASTRVSEGGGSAAEFVIECR